MDLCLLTGIGSALAVSLLVSTLSTSAAPKTRLPAIVIFMCLRHWTPEQLVTEGKPQHQKQQNHSNEVFDKSWLVNGLALPGCPKMVCNRSLSVQSVAFGSGGQTGPIHLARLTLFGG